MNESLFLFLYSFAHRTDLFDNLIIFLAIWFPFILGLSAGIYLIFYYKIFPTSNLLVEIKGKWRKFVPLVLSTAIAWGLAKILKILIHTARPFDIFPQVEPLFLKVDYAFPSGHTMVASAIAFAVFYTNKKAGYIFMALAFLIGLARIIAGVHFPIDILGGFVLGGLIAYLVAYFAKNV